MKKVLASVLAGSMVLGMASMASAATLVRADKTGDYDFRLLDVYTPDMEDYHLIEKWDDLAKLLKSEGEVDLVEAVEAYATAYSGLKKNDAVNTAAAAVDALEDIYDELDVNGKAAFVNRVLKKAYAGYTNFTDLKTTVTATLGSSGDKVVSSIKGTAKFGSALTVAGAKKVLPDPNLIKDFLTNGLGYDDGTGTYGIEDKTELELKDEAGDWWNLYTYGEDDCKEVVIQIPVKKGDNFRVDVNSGEVAVSRKKAETKNGVDYYNLKIKAVAGVRRFETDDFKVEVELEDRVFFIKGKVAYSDYRLAEPGEVYKVKKSDHTDNHLDGSIFKFDQILDDETRIICEEDYVDVMLKGNYGTDFENMRVLTDDIKEVEDFFQDYDIDYYDFIGTPKFAKDVTVRVDADSDSFIYEFDKKTGDVVDITDECTWDSNGWTFKRKSLKTYVVLEEPYEGGNVRADKEPVDDEPTEPDDTDATGSKPNPGTGAMPF